MIDICSFHLPSSVIATKFIKRPNNHRAFDWSLLMKPLQRGTLKHKVQIGALYPKEKLSDSRGDLLVFCCCCCCCEKTLWPQSTQGRTGLLWLVVKSHMAGKHSVGQPEQGAGWLCLNHTQEAERENMKWEKASSPPHCPSFPSLQQDSTF